MMDLTEQMAARDREWDSAGPVARQLIRETYRDAGWKSCSHPECPPFDCRVDHVSTPKPRIQEAISVGVVASLARQAGDLAEALSAIGDALPLRSELTSDLRAAVKDAALTIRRLKVHIDMAVDDADEVLRREAG